jgi:CubicO group peptidase (beta-lactamase class C family)
MNHTGFYVQEDLLERFSEIYRIDSLGKLQVNGFMSKAFKVPTKQFWGGAGLVANLSDYNRFCSMMLNGGELDGMRLLKEETVQMIMSDQSPEGVTFWENTRYGLGGSVNLETGEYDWGGAASTKFWIDPKNDMVIVTYAQLMPSDNVYEKDFKDIIERALIQ